MLNITLCKCVCLTGYKATQYGCMYNNFLINKKFHYLINLKTKILIYSPECDKKCPSNSILDVNKCECNCRDGFKYSSSDNQCLPTCIKQCPRNSELDFGQCQCVCNEGYAFDSRGLCQPTCTLKCPAFSTLDKNACKCFCNSGYQATQYGN